MKNVCSIEAERLIERLSALRVQGTVVDKRQSAPTPGGVERTLVIAFKGREIEKVVEQSEFDQAKVGDKVLFSPPVPECDLCTCHTMVCLVVGLVAGIVAVRVIAAYFAGRTAIVLCFVAAALVAVVAWARTCCHQEDRFLRDVEAEIRFFETPEPPGPLTTCGGGQQYCDGRVSQ